MYFSGGISGYEDRQCPQCGTLLTNPNVRAPYNAHFSSPGPYFCSANCFDKIFQPRFKRHLPPPKSLDEEAQREIQKLRQETARMAGVVVAHKGENHEGLSELYWEEDAKISRKIESLERRPKVNTEAEIQKATKEAINEVRDEWSRGWEEWVTAETKKDDEKYYREHPIINAVPPLDIDNDIKFDHTLCLAPSGAGKTTLMFYEILENLKKPDPPAMVIIDPKGTVLRQISSLACFHPLTGVHKDRLVIIDPSDLGGPPAFNLFKPTSAARLERYDPNSRAVLENKVVELLQYAFSSRNQPLTGKQAPCFTAVCRLLLKLPNPNFSLLLDVLNDQQSLKKQSFENCPWKDAINQLPEISARFFREQYYENYTSTRHEITSRLYGILEHPAIQSVFNTQENRFDMFDAIQRGKIVIVNVPFALLTSAGAELFGRYMIASTLAASFERVTIREQSKWRTRVPLHRMNCRNSPTRTKPPNFSASRENTSSAFSSACKTSRRSKKTRSSRQSSPTPA